MIWVWYEPGHDGDQRVKDGPPGVQPSSKPGGALDTGGRGRTSGLFYLSYLELISRQTPRLSGTAVVQASSSSYCPTAWLFARGPTRSATRGPGRLPPTNDATGHHRFSNTVPTRSRNGIHPGMGLARRGATDWPHPITGPAEHAQREIDSSMRETTSFPEVESFCIPQNG